MSLEKNKHIVEASDALLAQVEKYLLDSRLHPDEMNQELSYFFSGLWNRAESLVETMPKIKGHKPTKE